MTNSLVTIYTDGMIYCKSDTHTVRLGVHKTLCDSNAYTKICVGVEVLTGSKDVPVGLSQVD